MQKNELARRLARESHISQAAAADQLDRIVSEILDKLKHGRAARLPGLGTFLPGKGPAVRFEREAKPKK